MGFINAVNSLLLGIGPAYLVTRSSQWSLPTAPTVVACLLAVIGEVLQIVTTFSITPSIQISSAAGVTIILAYLWLTNQRLKNTIGTFHKSALTKEESIHVLTFGLALGYGVVHLISPLFAAVALPGYSPAALEQAAKFNAVLLRSFALCSLAASVKLGAVSNSRKNEKWFFQLPKSVLMRAATVTAVSFVISAFVVPIVAAPIELMFGWAHGMILGGLATREIVDLFLQGIVFYLINSSSLLSF